MITKKARTYQDQRFWIYKKMPRTKVVKSAINSETDRSRVIITKQLKLVP